MPGSPAVAPHPFRVALEQRDHAAMVACLAPDVTYSSPVIRTPIEGRDAVAQIFAYAIRSLEATEEFAITDELAGTDTHALYFHVRTGGVSGEAIWIMRCDDAGQIVELKTLVRPLAAIVAVIEARAPPPARGMACRARWSRSWPSRSRRSPRSSTAPHSSSSRRGHRCCPRSR